MGKGWFVSSQPCTKTASSISEGCFRRQWRPTKGRKKRGLQFALFLWKGRLIQTMQRKERSEQRRAYRCSPSLLHLPALQSQADAVGKLGGSEWHAPHHAARPADGGAGRQRLFVRRGGAESEGTVPFAS